MKYIRTKDGRIFEKEFVRYEKITNSWYYHNCYIDDGMAMEEADTIEELCDEFVYLNDLYNRFVGKVKGYDGKDYIRLEAKDGTNINVGLKNWEKIKGAIWTDKGLIYVAKMNEKGELELL